MRIEIGRRLGPLVLASVALAAGVLGRQGEIRPGGGPDMNLSPAFRSGLAEWRSPDLANTRCAFCHSPDGLEIAAYNFSDEDIRRRAIPHLGPEGADKIVAFIHEVRKRYSIKKLLDPMNDRPLQPTGKYFEGNTPEARDAAFGKSLVPLLPTLTTGDVNSLETALKAKEELDRVDPRKLEVGIPFNRISEDGFHGKEHATFAHWIADTPVQLHFPWFAYFLVQDSYLANPNSSEFFKLERFPEHDQTKFYLSQQMANSKYRALLIFQHVLRLQLMGKDAFDRVGPVLFGDSGYKTVSNPLFELGVFADQRGDIPFDQFQFPDATLNKKVGGPTQAEQIKQICVPSLWAGWLMDEGLQRIDTCPGPRAARIITERLLSDGPYPMHDAFMITKKLVTQGYEAEAWNDQAPQHFAVDYSGFLAQNNLKKYEPADPAARELYRKFVVNSLKMSMFLYQDQLEKNHTQYPNDPSLDNIAEIQGYVKDVAPADAAMVDGLAAKISAEEKQALPYKQ